MTKECKATIFQINLSFPNASHLGLKGTISYLSKSLYFPKSLGGTLTCRISQQKKLRFSGKNTHDDREYF